MDPQFSICFGYLECPEGASREQKMICLPPSPSQPPLKSPLQDDILSGLPLLHSQSNNMFFLLQLHNQYCGMLLVTNIQSNHLSCCLLFCSEKQVTWLAVKKGIKGRPGTLKVLAQEKEARKSSSVDWRLDRTLKVTNTDWKLRIRKIRNALV